MKTGGTCTLHKNYDFAAGEVEVQPLRASHTLPLKLQSMAPSKR